VKFRDAPRVLGAIGRAVRDALLESGAALWDAASAPGIDTVAQRRFELRQIGSQWSDSPSMDSLNQPESWLGDMAAQIPFQGVIPDPHPIELPMPSLADIRLLGQVQGAYIVAEAPNGICLIHQHVAHTRILYEQIQRQHADGSLVAQAREVSLTLEMPELAQSLLLQHASLLAEYGFAIEDFGMALRVRALPAILAPEYAAPTFAAIAGLLRQAGEQHVVVALLAIPIAEQAALRSGQRLEPPEMLALLADLARCQQPYRCPRGHPTLILLSADHLASWFGLEH
jgi:DNA mismatch repair protein MutL